MNTPSFRRILLVAFAICFASVSQALAFRTVVIDAGHGGHDLGAAEDLVYEKHINLDVARRLEISLKEMGYKTVLIRSTDVFVALQERAKMANKYRNAVFVSVHFNSAWRKEALGIETFYRDSKSEKFARLVQSRLIKNVGATDRGVKTANFAVLRHCRHPSILVEGGFISNKTERSAMLDPQFRQVVAESIAQGVKQFNNPFSKAES